MTSISSLVRISREEEGVPRLELASLAKAEEQYGSHQVNPVVRDSVILRSLDKYLPRVVEDICADVSKLTNRKVLIGAYDKKLDLEIRGQYSGLLEDDERRNKVLYRIFEVHLSAGNEDKCRKRR